MGNVKKYNQPLIPCTNRDQVLTQSKQSFEAFLTIFSDCGGEMNDTTVRLMKRSIDKNEYTVQQIEAAVIFCFENEQFFNWANIVKYLKRQQKEKINWGI